ncbi:hypothetical protein GCM10010112_16720 [Actinoplanes lobatus]|uniref:Uncharacterized protein n=1 Tax=Actinoplanes lobatus TaxID=113568 RepID=A0A7W7H993_9ACTN|nr:hypothetical protein [Actinoplanes lobatus]MBB4746365.1 hypothetical protein [Actinoplanes lobatus]GGN60435.1 hypothetical protein GCM10010112_16720 [Actinoplanes lobatus]GIE41254.1 hypothetical protein Alo02nite_41520 [Actinoplanes lobatus]
MIRPLIFAYAGLGGALAADGRPWLAAPLCLVALHAIGELWIRALPGRPAETSLPAVRAGLSAVNGLITLPLVALLLHLTGHQVRPVPLAAGAATTATLLAGAALLRKRSTTRGAAAPATLPSQRGHTTAPAPQPSAGHSSAGAAASADGQNHEPGYARTAAIVGVPVLLAVAVGAVAVRGYLKAPHPAEPGYLSIALSGWAAAINRPVTVPARGLSIPVRVASAGLADTTTRLRLRVGGRVVASEPLTVAADTVRSLTVHIPALPPDGCLHAIGISVGAISTGFYARGLSALTRSASCRGRHTSSGARHGDSGPAPADAAVVDRGDAHIRDGAAHARRDAGDATAPGGHRRGARDDAGHARADAAVPGDHRPGTRDGAGARPDAGGHRPRTRDGADRAGADADGGNRPAPGATAAVPGADHPGTGGTAIIPDTTAAPADATTGDATAGVSRPGFRGRFTGPFPAGQSSAPVLEKIRGPEAAEEWTAC